MSMGGDGGRTTPSAANSLTFLARINPAPPMQLRFTKVRRSIGCIHSPLTFSHGRTSCPDQCGGSSIPAITQRYSGYATPSGVYKSGVSEEISNAAPYGRCSQLVTTWFGPSTLATFSIHFGECSGSITQRGFRMPKGRKHSVGLAAALALLFCMAAHAQAPRYDLLLKG